MRNLTAARLRRLLDYNPKTGHFTWRVNIKGVCKGDRAGALKQTGYREIQIDRMIYREGRLAVLWMTGKFPPNEVDHINLKRADNRWVNLRYATRSQNTANSSSHKDKIVPYKGVCFVENRTSYKKYCARIRVNNKSHYLGFFANPKDAHAAYVVAARKYFGRFARSK